MKKSTTRTDPFRSSLPLRICTALLFWGALWWIASLIVDKEVLLPSPAAVIRVFTVLLQSGDFWLSILLSLLRILLGYFCGCILGVLTAALCFRSALADTLVAPLLSVIRAAPVASFIILALVWIERGLVPAFIAFLMVLPIIAGNVQTALRHVDKELLEVAALYRFDFLKTIRYVYLPAVRPYFRSGARTSLGLAWKAGVAAEVLCSLSASIGGNIYESKLYLETDALFAWTLTVILISILIEKLLFLPTPPHQGKEKTEDTE